MTTALPSNDYIGQINQNGSGLNIPQIVGALVDAEVEPLKAPVVARQEKVETAISGLALLKQSSELTNTNITKLKSSAFYSTSSTDPAQVAATVTDQSLVKVGNSKITNVSQLAQPMSFSIPAAGSPTAHYATPNAGLPLGYALTIRFGTFTDSLTGADSFAHDSATTTTTLNLTSGEGIVAVAQKLEAIEGLNARVVMVEASKYKILLTSEPGASNAFEISTGPATGSNPISVSTASTIPSNGSLNLDGALAIAAAAANASGISTTTPPAGSPSGAAIKSNAPLSLDGGLATVSPANNANGITTTRTGGGTLKANAPLSLGGALTILSPGNSTNSVSTTTPPAGSPSGAAIKANAPLSIDGGLAAFSPVSNTSGISTMSSVPTNGSVNTVGPLVGSAVASAVTTGISVRNGGNALPNSNLILNGSLASGGASSSVTLNFPQRVSLRCYTDPGSATFTITGTNAGGTVISETVGSGGSSGIFYTANEFKTITQVKLNGSYGGGKTVEVGVMEKKAIPLSAPQKVTITSGGDDRGVQYRVIGTKADGSAQTELVTGSNAGTATSSYEFKTITSITAVGTPAGTVTAGVEGKGTISNSVPQKVTIASSGLNGGIFFDVVGTNAAGGAQTERVAGPNTGIATSSFEFKTITSITAVGTPTGSVTVGLEGKGTVTNSTPQKVTITSGGNDSGMQYRVIGTKADGSAQTELVTGSNAGTATSSYEFKTVTSITAVGTPAGTVTAGLEGKGTITNNFPQKVTITSGGNDSVINFRVIGTNADGSARNEIVAGASAGQTATSSGDFKTVTSITAVGTPAGSVTAGVAVKTIASNAAARKITITSGGNDSGITFRIVGTKADGSALMETVTGATAGGVATSSGDFKTVTSITATGTPAGSVTAGVSGSFTDSRAFDVWVNTNVPATLRVFDQAAKNLVFKLDGVDLERESNTVTDAIPGVTLDVKVAGGVGVEIKTVISKTNVQETVQKFIDEINAYKADLLALSRVDRTGAGENGDLFGDHYVKTRLRALTDFMLKPIKGYNDLDETTAQATDSAALPAHPEKNGGIFLSTMGFKTQKDGTIGFDQTTFDRTFTNAPETFDALTKDQARCINPDFTVTWNGKSSDEGGTDPGVYEFFHEPHGATVAIYQRGRRQNHSQHINPTGPDAAGYYSYDGGGTGYGFPGLVFRTKIADPSAHNNPANNIAGHVPLNVYLGKSFTTLFSELHDDVLNNTVNHRRQIENYQTKRVNLQERLDRIDLRSNSLAQTYNEQFQAMEESVTGFKSTGNYLTSIVDQWNNR